MISEGGVRRRYPLGGKAESFELSRYDFTIAQDACAIASKTVDGNQPLQKIKGLRKALLQCRNLRRKISQSSSQRTRVSALRFRQAKRDSRCQLSSGRFEGTVESALATIGAILVNDSPLGGFVERCRHSRVLRFRFLKLARRNRHAKFFLGAFKCADDAGIANSERTALAGSFSCGFGIGHEERLRVES